SLGLVGSDMFIRDSEITADKNYVLKIAPQKSTSVMTYEKNMMQTEVYWYNIIRSNTDIKVPEVYYTDFSKALISSDWFIMEKLEGKQRNEVKIDKAELEKKTAQMVAQIHKIKNDKFGYVQNQLYDNWYDALTNMIKNLLLDAQKMNKKSKNGEKLLGYAEKYKSILKNVPCCMVNYDIWDPNVICRYNEKNEIEFQWIDPERSFWGDGIFDFICLGNLVGLMENKKSSIQYYNEVTDLPVKLNKETSIRFAFAMGLLALIQEVEKYYRYSPRHFGWWRNIACSKFYYARAFGVLKNG
ncbi:MAG: aminoglycoside phosphotransferase family protein, partial [Eubacterium sp.]|nr:aminoglycoside phosphotransferase family protein [Eubacterium sp.]